jgi:hypothetical protein
MVDEQQQAHANRLYWESERSVAGIADEMGISRRALYDLILPRPAGTACPECGGGLEFRNRRAFDRQEATCRECGRESAAGEATAVPPPPPRPGGIGLAVALTGGMAAGALAGLFLRRR